MLKYRTKEPKYLHVVSIYDLPENDRAFVRDWSQRSVYDMLDYRDGDYHYVVDLSLAQKDPTPDGLLESFEDETLDESAYGYLDWPDHVPSGTPMFEYAAWLRVIRYLAANLPQDVVSTNKLAIFVSH